MNNSITQLWQKSQSQIWGLGGNQLKKLVHKSPNLNKAFSLEKRSLCCIDGGIAQGLHLAGSGVLIERSDLIALVRKHQIEEFTTHSDCGAFAKAFPPKTAPFNVRVWGENMAKYLELPYRHITADEMDRANGFHNEAVIYYDATLRFNRTPGMPIGFTVSRFNKELGLSGLQLALDIAFGSHGFGERFGPMTPLYIVPIAHPKDSQLSLITLEKEIRQITQKYAFGRIAIAGLKTAWILRDA